MQIQEESLAQTHQVHQNIRVQDKSLSQVQDQRISLNNQLPIRDQIMANIIQLPFDQQKELFKELDIQVKF